MKRKNYFIFLSIMLALTGCNRGGDTSIIDSSSSDEIIDEGDGSYEAREVVIDMNGGRLSGPKKYEKIGHLDGYIYNPVRYITNNITNKVTISFCGPEHYKDEIIVYSADFHYRTTLDRSGEEGVKEYFILPQGDGYVVDSVVDGSKNVIPINGLVVSIPAAANESLNVGESIELGFTYNQYRSAVYNQDGERIAFKYLNDNYFFWRYESKETPSPAFFDSNADSNLVQQTNETMVSVIFDYDAENQAYVPTKFSKMKSARKQEMDIADGFALLMSENLSTAIKLENGIIISENDQFFFETVPGHYQEDIVLSTGEVNTVGNAKFNVQVSTTESSRPTGEWKYDIAVVNGVVVDRAVNIPVPANGYVLTLFAADGQTIESLVKPALDLFTVGAKVNRLGSTITVNYDCEDLTETYVNYTIGKINNAIAQREVELQDVDVTYAKLAIEEINAINAQLTELKNNTTTETLKYRYYNLFHQIENIWEDVYSSTHTTQAVNMHSIWHYPTETTLKDLQKTLDTFVANNINEVFIDVLSEGYTFFKSKILNTHESLANGDYGSYTDYIDAFITEAHNRGLKVQAIVGQWMQHAGVVERYPEFAAYYALNIHGEKTQETLDGVAQYFDPANEIVTELYLDLYEELLENYNLDGLHLDGIRYGASNDNAEQSQGITNAARERFNDWLSNNNKSLSFDTLDDLRTGLRNQTTFAYFNEFRREVVTTFVADCNAIAEEHGVITTAAVVAGLNYARNAKLQAWDEWSQQGIIDGLYLMSYYIDGGYVEKTIAEAVSAVTSDTYIVGGVSPIYSSLPGIQVSEQIIAASSVPGSVGSSIFAGHSFSVRPDMTNYLNSSTGGVYSDKTTVVYDKLSVSMNSFRESLLQRSKEIYQPANAQSAEQYSALEADLNILVSLTSDADSLNEVDDVIAKLDAMITKVSTYGNDKAQTRILETLQYAKRIATYKKAFLD